MKNYKPHFDIACLETPIFSASCSWDSPLFFLSVYIFSDNTAYSYCTLQWCGQYGGCSAPADTAFLLCIPYGIGIVICAVLALLFHKKCQNSL